MLNTKACHQQEQSCLTIYTPFFRLPQASGQTAEARHKAVVTGYFAKLRQEKLDEPGDLVECCYKHNSHAEKTLLCSLADLPTRELLSEFGPEERKRIGEAVAMLSRLRHKYPQHLNLRMFY